MNTLKKILTLGLILQSLFMVACSKDSGGSSAVVTAVTYYTAANGLCYQTGTNTQVAQTLCTAATGYQLINNLCYQTSTGQVVNQSLCYNNTGAGVSCIGYYRWNNQTVYCNGADCRGYTLVNLNTNATQVCQ